MLRATCWLLLAATAAVTAGCGAPSVPRDRITFAVLGGVYYAARPGAQAEAAMAEEAEATLRKAVADLNAVKDLDFVVLSGDLLAQADGLSLDRAKAILAELKAPYYMVLGAADGPRGAAACEPAAGAAGDLRTSSPAAPAAGSTADLSRTAVTWAFQGHGFSGADGYWSREVLPGLVLVGLDTVQPGRIGGHVDAAQLAWLERTLSACADKAVVVATYHELLPMHPLDEGSAWRYKMVDNAAAVRQVLERHPNVLMVLAGNCRFAEGRVQGRVVYLSSPSASIWPMAYHLVRLTPREAEAVWVPLASDEVARRAQDRLLGSAAYRGVFPPGEDGDTACVRLFGGKKMEVYPLPAIRP